MENSLLNYPTRKMAQKSIIHKTVNFRVEEPHVALMEKQKVYELDQRLGKIDREKFKLTITKH